MVQLPTTLRILGLIGKPSRILPQIKVDDIRQLNFPALKALGYRGVVFDKDNCITKPGVDTLLPHLQDSWNSCVSTFGPSKVLIVSNSSGTKSDAGWLGAEALHRSTGVPVLLHAKKKPFCHQEVSDYFSLSLTTPLTSTGRLFDPPSPSISSPVPTTRPSPSPSPSSSSPSLPTSSTALIVPTILPPLPGSLGILVIGDRLLTDTILTSLLPRSPPSISILTTLLAQPKDVRFLRLLERALERLIRRSTGISYEVTMREWREMGAVKLLPEEVETKVGLVKKVGGWVESGRKVGRGVRGGLEVVGREVRRVGRGAKWVGGKVGLTGGKAGGGEKVVGGGGEKKVLEVESVLGAGKGGVDGVRKVEEVVMKAKEVV
ncbi:mitochondrial PGP phosphatase-domain-containing protein [Mrakia frigida]|uniref:phosphatidylglycerophosphatase n=1 Tax=Mrakia frigida TaxID=29902 RepID=UPI003FCC1CD9